MYVCDECFEALTQHKHTHLLTTLLLSLFVVRSRNACFDLVLHPPEKTGRVENSCGKDAIRFSSTKRWLCSTKKTVFCWWIQKLTGPDKCLLRAQIERAQGVNPKGTGRKKILRTVHSARWLLALFKAEVWESQEE